VLARKCQQTPKPPPGSHGREAGAPPLVVVESD